MFSPPPLTIITRVFHNFSCPQFDHDSLTKGFSRDLQQFYGKANEQDKRRCLELLATLHIGEDLSKKSAVRKPTRPKDTKLQRPKTAMASFGTFFYLKKHTQKTHSKLVYGLRFVMVYGLFKNIQHFEVSRPNCILNFQFLFRKL